MDVAVLISLKGMRASPAAAAAQPYINQDRAFILELAPRFTAYAVFDGHGTYGHHVAEFVSCIFKKSIYAQYHKPAAKKHTEAEILRFLHSLFAHANDELTRAGIDITHSGCTGSVALRYHQSIYVAYVGDSKVATLHFHGKKPYCLMETPEHNPGCPGEAERIKQCGSSITVVNVPFFTKPISRIVEAGLSVSRSFGDSAARRHGVNAVPDLIKFEIHNNSHTHHSSRYPVVLVVASDGLWDTATYLDLLEHINNNVQPQQKVSEQFIAASAFSERRRALTPPQFLCSY